MSEIIHYASVKDGAVVQFPFSAYYFMKVCTRDGHGAIVNLWTGELLFARELEADNLGHYCKVVADSLDEFVREDEEEEQDESSSIQSYCIGNCEKCSMNSWCLISDYKPL